MRESKKSSFSEWLSTVQSGTTGSSSIEFSTIATTEENKKLHEIFKVIKEAEGSALDGVTSTRAGANQDKRRTDR